MNMNRKKIITIYLLISGMLCMTSCEDWLNTVSSSQITADDLLSDRTGYYEALTGIYLNMGANCYGDSYTWWLQDMTCMPYVIMAADLHILAMQNHAYGSRTDIKSTVENVWQNGYNVIANINLILKEIDADKGVFYSEVEYNLVKGELLGLRAYVHFDLMRMFGVADWSGENASKMAVPYVTELYKEPVPQKSYAETEKILIDDIENALECLKDDPVRGKISDDFNATANADGYWNYRTRHMNYYAVEALAARVYQWKKEYETAAEYARDVIDNTIDKNDGYGNKIVEWTDIESFLNTLEDKNRDWTFSTEHIFSMEISGLWDKVNTKLFESLGNAEGSLRLDGAVIDNILYPRIDDTGSLAGSEDVRGPAMLLKNSSDGYRCYKLYGGSDFSEQFRNRMPMIKIAEMYYIIAEYCINDGRPSDALKALDTVRNHRGIQSTLDGSADPSEELMKEYYREFVNEGQLFYWLKHNNLTEPPYYPQINVSAASLTYPYPDEELSYGRVQEL